jgi:hypothetical protein
VNPLLDSRKQVLLILGVSRACTDTGGTTLCNNGDTCLYLQDVSGNGFHAVQNGANPGPVYRTAGLGGLPYLDFSGGKSLKISPGGLNSIQGTYDYTVYGFGTTSTGTLPGNGVGKHFCQCADSDFNGVFDLQVSNGTLFGSGYGVVAQTPAFPNASGSRPYYTPASSYVRFGWTVNSTARWRMLYNGFGCGGNGLSPSGSATNTTGDIIIGGKYFTAWADWRNWYGQWHGLCIYASSLSSPEVWQLDAYIRGLRSQPHAIESASYIPIWDGNSHAGINSKLVPEVVRLLGIYPTTVAQHAYHFKTTQNMIDYGGEIDDLVALMRGVVPNARIVLCFHELTNAFGSNPAATLYAQYQTYAAARLAGGVNALVCADMLDQQSMSGSDETRRATLNALVAANTSPPWHYVGWGSAGSPTEPWSSPEYSDSLHLNDQGNTDVAPMWVTPIQAASRPGVTLFMNSYRRRRVG